MVSPDQEYPPAHASRFATTHWSVVVAAGTIILVIRVAYGDLKYGFYSILPNMFALTMTIAVRAWMAPSLEEPAILRDPSFRGSSCNNRG